ncbi:F0F1 ATP synthase subunit A, partial [Bacteroidota bacterium]
IQTGIFFKLVLIFILIFFTENLSAQHEKEDGIITNQESADVFSPGEFIVDHIGDSFYWHLLTIGHTHISVPLPIILYSKERGLFIFMSNKFHHGKESYKGFKVETEWDNEGKIVEILPDGTTDKNAPLPLSFSITKNVAALIFSLILLLVIFIPVSKAYRRNKGKAPKGLQSFVEPLILFVRDEIAKPSIGEKKYEKYTPYLLSIFFFIFLNNLLGLIPIFPGGANVTGNIAVTMVLAVFTFIITTISANKNYWKHIFNAPGVPWWLKFPIPLMPIIEVLGVFTKPFVLMVRLFANITAGHIIALSFFSLIFIFGKISPGLGYGVSVISVAFTIFMTLLELLVAFIQAYVFTLLSALYFGLAITEDH